MAELWETPARELAGLIRCRVASPVEVLQSITGRMDEVNSGINAVVTSNPRAEAQARLAERAVMRSEMLGPMHGVPYTLKDLTPTAGLRTTYGCELSRDHVPTADALVGIRLEAAGGILLGKTNTPDHGCKAVTDNSIFGPTRNPWNLGKTSGGSSGGAAAAVASGIGPIAEGSDFAGSVRIPAAHCGVLGLKPSDGRIPVFPNSMPFFPVSFVHGPIARNAGDLALMMDVMSGADSRDPRSVERESGRTYEAIALDPSRLTAGRVAWLGDMGVCRLDPEIEQIAMSFLGTLDQLGLRSQSVTLDMGDVTDAYALFNSMKRAAALSNLAPGELAALDPVLLQRVKAVEGCSAIDLTRALEVQAIAYRRVQRIFETFDFIALPTTPCEAFDVGLNFPDTIGGAPLGQPLELVGLTAVFNLTGHPAISVPAGHTVGGLPVGVQIVGPWRRDSRLILLAAAVESIRPAIAWPKLGTSLGG